MTSHITASDNIFELRRMGRDPALIWATRPDTLYGLVKLMDRAERDIGRVSAPTLYLYGAHDELIPKAAAFRAVSRLPAGARTAYYADGWHILLRDYEAERIWRDVESFIDSPAAPLPSGSPPIPTTLAGR